VKDVILADIISMINSRAIIIRFTAAEDPTVRPLELIEAMIGNLKEYGLDVEYNVEADEALVGSVTYRVFFHGQEMGDDFPGIMLVSKFTPAHNDEASERLFADWYSGRIKKVTVDYFDNTGEWDLDVFDRLGENVDFGPVKVLVNINNFDGVVAMAPDEDGDPENAKVCFLPFDSLTYVAWDFSVMGYQLGDVCTLTVKTTHVIDRGMVAISSQQAYLPQHMSMHPFVILNRIDKMKENSRGKRTRS